MPRFKPKRGLKRRNWIMVEIFVKGEDHYTARQGRKRLKLTADREWAKIKIDGRLHEFKVYVYEKKGKFIPYIEIPERYFE